MRTSSEITIRKVNNESETVLVTAASKRRWKLMEEDNISLSFVHNKPIEFTIGDYVDVGEYTNNEITGRFYITETPAPPEYDINNGAHKYELRFDREYIGWKNIIFQMTRKNRTYERKELSWTLTDTIDRHIQELIKNLSIVGQSYRYCLGSDIYRWDGNQFTNLDSNGQRMVIDYPFPAPDDLGIAKSISYSGTSIYDGLKDGICKSYNCEFWVIGDVLCLGKCEIGSTVDFCLAPTERSIAAGVEDINVESIRPSRNTEEYANRLYVFGSTKNLPYSYRKNLIFTADEVDGGSFRDRLRPLTTDIIKGASTDKDFTPSFYSGKVEGGNIVPSNEFSVSKEMSIADGFLVHIIVNYPPVVGDEDPRWPIYAYSKDGDTYNAIALTSGGYNEFTFPVLTKSEFIIQVASEHASKDDVSVHMDGKERVNMQIEFDGTLYNVQYSIDGWLIGSIPGFGIGSQFTIPEQYMNMACVKQSYYSSEYGDPSSLSHIGENRLRLPENGPQFIGDSSLPTSEVVEKVVFFENVFPKCALRVTEVKTVTGRTTVETFDDGSSARYEVTKYTIKVKRITSSGDVAFPFDRSMLLSGEALQVKFLTREEEDTYGSVVSSPKSLAGMTFDVKWNQTDKSFTIVWNQTYGAQLPNDSIRPWEGDSLILIGWNVNAMGNLGIISTAENELWVKGNRYLAALDKFQYTFACNMMSGFGVLEFGRKVKVWTDSVPEGYYSSRVIGYELKLDIPEDTPIYTIGDTEAYSRLKELQKSLESTEGGVSLSGETTNLISGGEGETTGGTDMLTVWKSLTNDGGLEDFSDTTEIDINHIPNIPQNKIEGDLGGYFEIDTQNTFTSGKRAIKLKDEYEGLWTEGFMTSGGIGRSGSGGGLDVPRMWQSLTNYNSAGQAVTPDNDYQVNPVHLPTISISGDATSAGSTYNYDFTRKGSINISIGIEKGTSAILDEGTDTTYRLWSADVLKSQMGSTYSQGTGISILNNVISLDVDGAKTALGLGNAAYRGVATTISSGDTALVSSDLLSSQGYLTSVPVATDAVVGGFKTGFTSQAVGGRAYAVNLNEENRAYVTVSWTDTKYKLTLNGQRRGDSLGTDLGSFYAPTSLGAVGTVLTSDILNIPIWTDISVIYYPIAGNKTITGDVTIGTDEDNKDLTVVGNVTAQRFYLDDDVYFVKDENGVKLEGAGFYTDSFITSGGIGGNSGGGIDLQRMWASLQNTDSLPTYNNYKIAAAHLVSTSASETIGLIIGSGLTYNSSTRTLSATGTNYTGGTGIDVNNGVISLNVAGAQSALGLGAAAYLGVAASIGASVDNLVDGKLLYGVLGDSFDSSNTVKGFINSSIATATATFRGTNDVAQTEQQFLTWANNLTHDLNDYVFWSTTDSDGNTVYKRYKYDGTNWVFEYNLNNSSFTAAQWSAINSGITSTKVGTYDTIASYFDNSGNIVKIVDIAYLSNSNYKVGDASAIIGGSYSGLALNSIGNASSIYFRTGSIQQLQIDYDGKVYLGGTTYAKQQYLQWDENNKAWHLVGNFYADGFITAGGIGSNGNTGVDLIEVWASLQNTSSVSTYDNYKIHASHLISTTSSDICLILGSGLSYNSSTRVLSATGTTYSEGTGIDINNGVISLDVNATKTALGLGLAAYQGIAETISTSSTGLAKASDVARMGYITSIPAASNSGIGGFKTGFSESGKYYAVSLDINDKAYVYVPWGDYSLPLAANGTRGGIQIGYTPSSQDSSNRYYPVQLSGEKAYVNVPWVNTTYKLTVNGNTNGDSTYGTSLGTVYTPTSLGTQGYAITADSNGYPTAWVDIANTYYPIAGGKTITGNVTIGTSASNKDLTVVGNMTAKRIYLDSNVYFVKDSNGVKLEGAGFYTDSFITSGGIGSGSGSFVTLDTAQTISGVKTFSSATAFNTMITAGNIVIGLNGTGTSATREIKYSGDKLYIQRSTNTDLVLCHGNNNRVAVGTHNPSVMSANKFYVDGTALATAWNTTSDIRLKDNIQSITNEEAIEKLMALRPVSWTWKGTTNDGEKASGLVAQEVEPIIPHMVHGVDYKSLAYDMLHAYEIKGLQNHEARIRELEKENAELKRRLGYANN